jgi:hypothetical protein
MKIFKLITWYPNMVQYTFNFHKGKISFKLFLEYIFVIWIHKYITFFSTNKFQFPIL